MSLEHVPDSFGADHPWTPGPGGLSAHDLDRMPGLPAHTELIDGGLFLMSPQRAFHMLVIQLLYSALNAARPDSLRVRQQMSVVIGAQHRPEPDVMLIDADAVGDVDETWYPAKAVSLVVEVVSPESQDRDRRRKPQLYAEAAIQHFWRVEENAGLPVVYVYELDPSGPAYSLTGIHHDRLELTIPFPIHVDLSVINDQ